MYTDNIIKSEELNIDYERAFIKINNLQDGIYYCGKKKGFINVTKKPFNTSIIWTSQSDGHNFTDGIGDKAIYVEFKENSIGNVLESAISMWLVKDKKEQIDYALYIIGKVENHYDFKYQEAIKKNKKGFFQRLFS